MKNLRQLVVVTLVLLFVFVGAWLILLKQNRAEPGQQTPPSTKTENPADAAGKTTPSTPPLDLSPAAQLARILDKLRAGTHSPAELDAFRRALLAADPAQAITAIVKFLATGQDALTSESFALGKGGELGGAPTLRVLLLDILGRICKTTEGPEAAAVSRALLEKKTSADEWAVALRNVAWGTPGDRAFLAAKSREMLHYQPWRQQPSGGFLEAFDVIVFSRDATFVTDLAEIVRGDDKTLQRGAGMALDRLAEMAPLDVMNFLNTNRAELADKPFLRADYFSKADLSQPAQRAALEAYLSRTDVDAREKGKLLAVLASPGSFAGDTLVTDPPPEEDPPQRSAGLKQAVGEWLKTNRFPELNPSLQQLQERLAQ